MCLLESWFFDLQKNRSQKLSMLEEKQGIPIFDFRLIFLCWKIFK